MHLLLVCVRACVRACVQCVRAVRSCVRAVRAVRAHVYSEHQTSFCGSLEKDITKLSDSHRPTFPLHFVLFCFSFLFMFCFAFVCSDLFQSRP